MKSVFAADPKITFDAMADRTYGQYGVSKPWYRRSFVAREMQELRRKQATAERRASIKIVSNSGRPAVS